MTTIQRIDLSAVERDDCERVVNALTCAATEKTPFTEQNYLANLAAIEAHALPRRIRAELYRFKLEGKDDVALISNCPLFGEEEDPTPTTFEETQTEFRLSKRQILHALLGAILGEPIGFTSQRNGSLFNTIVPTPGNAAIANSSSGSKYDFGFHVEDAFHPMRAEYVGLLCLRNQEQAKTTVSSVRGFDCTGDNSVLFDPLFTVEHNPIHASEQTEQRPTSILFGSRTEPYVTVNFATMDVDSYPKRERVALQALQAHFNANNESIVLQPGESIFIDNLRCAHARDAFVPLPAGRCRWLNRVVFTTDLRKSRGYRRFDSERQLAPSAL